MGRRLGLRFASLALALSLTGVVMEFGLRILSRVDVDRNVFVGKYRLRPFHFPIEHIRSRLEQRSAIEVPYIRHDDDLGWSVALSSASPDGRYVSNRRGIRSTREAADTEVHPLPGRLRIALYGDSFTHGDDVDFADTWGAVLAEELGNGVEVLNQGTPGYGMDQAFLRWRKEGRPLSPQIVIFGFQSTDARRNLNLLRNLYTPTSNLTFSKPRFAIDGKGLRLVNVPVPKPSELVDLLKDFEKWPLRSHEFFYRPENYAYSPFYKSRVIAFLSSGVATRFSHRRRGTDFFAPGSRSYTLAWRIVERFEREVEANGARFVVLHIPTRKPLRRVRAGRPLPYQALFDEMVVRFDVVDPTAQLLHLAEAESLAALFAPDSGHFSGLANEVLGRALAQHLADGKRIVRSGSGAGRHQ